MDLKKGDLLVSNGNQLQRGIECKVIDVLPNDIIVTSEDGVDYVYAKHFIFEYFDKEEYTINFDSDEIKKLKEKFEAPKHYDTSKGSLYLFAEQHNLNAWEFDAIKRIVRSRKKGNFIEDLNKTIHVLELYKKEYERENS